MAQQKSPSELSFEIFAANVAADETIPIALRNAAGDNKNKKISELLAAINQAIGEAK